MNISLRRLLGVPCLAASFVVGATAASFAQQPAPPPAPQGQQPGVQPGTQGTPIGTMPGGSTGSGSMGSGAMDGTSTTGGVKINLGKVANAIAKKISVASSAIPASIMAPATIAAKVCNTDESTLQGKPNASCDAATSSPDLEQLVEKAMKPAAPAPKAS